jgi:hypothetical protein
VTESEIDVAGREGRGTQYWAEYVAEKLRGSASAVLGIETAAIRQIIVSTVRRRFGTDPESKPTGKALVQAINDAFSVAAFAAHGLTIGATDIDVLKSWGSQLRILDQSRYVPGFEGFNLIWLAADIEDDPSISIQRRDLQGYELKVAREVVAAYQRAAIDGLRVRTKAVPSVQSPASTDLRSCARWCPMPMRSTNMHGASSRGMGNRLLADNRAVIDAAAAAIALPDDLAEQVEALLKRNPSLPWDIAVATIARRIAGIGDAD